MSVLKGIISPFTTPFSENGEIDYSLVKPQVDWLIDNGVHGLAAGGSTGEGHVLDREEYKKLMKTTVDSVDGNTSCRWYCNQFNIRSYSKRKVSKRFKCKCLANNSSTLPI